MNEPMGNGHCGQKVKITNKSNGKSVTATVADLCPGCSYGSLDLSTGTFKAIGDLDTGVLPIGTLTFVIYKILAFFLTSSSQNGTSSKRGSTLSVSLRTALSFFAFQKLSLDGTLSSVFPFLASRNLGQNIIGSGTFFCGIGSRVQ
jgi:hypothetical protein